MERETIRYQTTAEGREQATKLRPLNIVRRPASPRVVCPDPSKEQMERLLKERKRYKETGHERIKGVIYPSGLMLIEFRIYKNGKPWLRQAVNQEGKVLFTAMRESFGRTWSVKRGQRGKWLVPLNMTEYEATLIITGRIKPGKEWHR